MFIPFGESPKNPCSRRGERMNYMDFRGRHDAKKLGFLSLLLADGHGIS